MFPAHYLWLCHTASWMFCDHGRMNRWVRGKNIRYAGNKQEWMRSWLTHEKIRWQCWKLQIMPSSYHHHHYHHHHHVPEGLGVFPVPWSSRWSWSLHLLLGRPMFLLPFGLYCSACFGSLCPSSVHVVATFLVQFYFFYHVLCSRFLSNTLMLFFI